MNKESLKPDETTGPAALTREEAEGVAGIAAEATNDSSPAQSLSETKPADATLGKLRPSKAGEVQEPTSSARPSKA